MSAAKVKVKNVEEACAACGLSADAIHPFIGPKGNLKNPKMAIFGECPGVAEDKCGINFVGASGDLLKSVLSRVGLTNVYIDNVVICCPKDGKKARNPSDQEIDFCRWKLRDRIASLPEGTLIVPLGGSALYGVLRKKAINQHVGSLYHVKIGDKTYPVIPNIHPSHVLRNTNNRKVGESFLNTFRLISDYLSGTHTSEINFRILKPAEALSYMRGLIKKKSQIPHLYMDIETSDLIFHRSRILGVSLANDLVDECIYIPFESHEWDYQISSKERDELISAFGELVDTFPVIGHNVKFDIAHSIFSGKASRTKFIIKCDTYVMAHIIYNRDLFSLSLKDLARHFFNVFQDWELPVKQMMASLDKEERTFAKVPTAVLGEYSATDIHYTKKLYKHMEKDMRPEFYQALNMNHDVETALVDWELNGVKINREVHGRLKGFLEQEISTIYAGIRSIKEVADFEVAQGKKLNLNSSPQLSKVAFKNLKLPVMKASKKTGEPSLDKEAMAKYADLDTSDNQHLFLSNLAEFRAYDKLLTQHVDVMPKYIDEYDIYRSEFHICGTITGRLTSIFHSMPSRGDKKDLKRMVESRWKGRGGIIVAEDYSQLEPRVLASMSGDVDLIEAYMQGLDIYRYTGSEVFKKEIAKITKKEREDMKTLFLGIIYGKGIKAIARDTKHTEEESKGFQDSFYKRFHGAANYIERMHAFAKRHGYIENAFGRRIPVPEAKSNDRSVVEEGMRYAQNYPIQSTASELALHAFYEDWKACILKKLQLLVMASVHDSNLKDVMAKDLYRTMVLDKFVLEQQQHNKYEWLKCPLHIDISIGTSWGGTLDVSMFSSDKDCITLELSGLQSDLDSLAGELQNAYRRVNVTVTSSIDWVPPPISLVGKTDSVSAVVELYS